MNKTYIIDNPRFSELFNKIKLKAGNDCIDEKRIASLLYVYFNARKAIGGEEIKVTYNVFTPRKSFGYVSINGKNLFVKNPDKFNEISRMSSNIEVYPKIDRTLTLSFGFNNLILKR